MSELTDLSLTEIVAALQAGQVSSRALVEAYLARTERLEPALHAYLCLDASGARAQADAADRRLIAWRKDGAAVTDPLPPLLGVPLAVKDVLCVQGLPCTCGSRILEGYTPPFDATAVARLRQAGMVILGKTNTDEFAMGSSTENSAYGPSHNPYDVGRVPGGSSGGSAAAVAGRLAPAALGTDTGGSVRQPAAFCGLTGIKPGYGRVSRYGLVAYGSSLDSAGVLAHSAQDAALVFAQMAGHDPLDATTAQQPVPEINFAPLPGAGADRPLQGLRVGVPDEYFIPGMQPEVEAAVRAAVAALEGLGARVQPVSLPHTKDAVPVYYLISPAEASANLARYDGIRYGPREAGDTLAEVYTHTRGRLFGPEVKRRIMLGTYALSAGYYEAYYHRAQQVRALIQQDFEQAFSQVDVIAAPVTPTTAFPFGAHRDDPLAMYLEDVFTLPANLAGIPGLAFPVGADARGLPVGMQLMGPRWSEAALFQAAHAYQQASDWRLPKPTLIP